MLLRFITFGSLLLIVAFLAAISLARAQSYHDDNNLRAFLSPPLGCPAPCWQGIRPGVTTGTDAFAILESLEWVESVDLYIDLNSVVWTWSGTQPSWIDATERGVLTMDGKSVQYIRIRTNLKFGDVWLALGAPEQNIVRLAAFNLRAVEQVAFYFGGNVRVVRNPMSCRMWVTDYWNHPVDILLDRQPDLGLNGPSPASQFDLYDRPYC